MDTAQNITYEATASSWPLGQVWAEAPSDSGVASFVGTLDITTGSVRPVLVGFGSPSGLIWVDSLAVDEGF